MQPIARTGRACTPSVVAGLSLECQGSEELLSPRSSSAARSVTPPLAASSLTLRTQSRSCKAFFSVFLTRYAHGGILFSVFASVVVFVASTVSRRSTSGVCVLYSGTWLDIAEEVDGTSVTSQACVILSNTTRRQKSDTDGPREIGVRRHFPARGAELTLLTQEQAVLT